MAAESRTLDTNFAAPQQNTTAWELVVFERRQRRVFRLPEQGLVTIGRGADCDVRLDDSSVSRKHARLHLPSLEVEDLESRNGTFLQDRPAYAATSAVVERSRPPEVRLVFGVRRALFPGFTLRLGQVLSQVQPCAPALRTLPVGPMTSDEHDGAPVLEDPAMLQLYALVERVADTSLPLLILGETGVGKDVLAAHVHRTSPRRARPFVRVNCGALSESLLESELFGHQRGAFTGASEAKPGLFELGHGGTVFLDEIGELPLRTQVKLLHVLETGQVTRVGGTKAQSIDARFIAATNRELARDVQTGSFRKDLYFRINTLCLKIQPLRERRADILPLVRHFLLRSCAGSGEHPPELLPETTEHLKRYGWPGNVRELKNAVDRAWLLCAGGALLPEHFPTERELMNPAPDVGALWADAEPTQVCQRPPLDSSPAAVGASELMEALNSCSGNQTRAAELLGISRRTLVNRLNAYNLPRPRKGRS
jgi:two-component system, NtrC family, response regulator AtoC